VPKFLGTSASASDNGLKQTLGVIRGAIELYTAEHEGTLPGPDEAGLKTALLPYLRVFPKSPLTNTDTVAIAATPGTTTASGAQA